MQLSPGPGEPVAGPWRTVTLTQFAHDLVSARAPASASASGPAGPAAARPGGRYVIAVDGRSGGGKTTLARRLAAVLPDAVLVGTDDVAWKAPMFGWADLLAEGVLRPFRAGQHVCHRPSAWVEHDRPGALEVPVDTRWLVVEGVGASQLAFDGLLDVAVWLQSDYAEAERRGIARDVASGVNGDEAASVAFWHAWMADEDQFFDRDRPWERADVVVLGTHRGAEDPDGQDPQGEAGGGAPGSVGGLRVRVAPGRRPLPSMP